MKSLLLLFLVTASYGASIRRLLPIRAGQVQTYSYTASANTAIPGAPQNSAQSSTLDVKVQIKYDHDSRALMQITECTAPSSMCKDLKQFSVSFEYDNGQVQAIHPDRSDPLFSINIKRGIISMLNI